MLENCFIVNKYKIIAGTFYNKISKYIVMKDGGEVWNRIPIAHIEIEGQKPFKELTYGGELVGKAIFDSKEEARTLWGDGLRPIDVEKAP
jgi:hypothetical protein